MDQEHFSGKTVVVSGAGAGIGLATVQRFLQVGANVVAIDNSSARCDALRGLGSAVTVIHADLSTAEGLATIEAEYVSRQVSPDVLVNVAGRLLVKPFLECDRNDWSSLLDMNVGSMALMSRLVLPSMVARRAGNIVNVASLSGHLATPLESVYCVSKAAIIQLTRSIAIEFRRQGIRCNCVSPALVDTDHGRVEIGLLTDAGVPLTMDDVAAAQLRPAEPREIANAIFFLASDQSSFMNGAELMLDNGFSCGAGG